jgi:hypothetical protein
MTGTMRGAAAALALAALAGAAWAQGDQVQPELISGKVQAVTASQLTISSQGLNQSFVLNKQTEIMTSRPGTLADIKAGSFLGTTNTPTGAASGDSTEVHIFPPGVKMGEGDRPMGPQASGSRMTNGTVSSTAKGPAGDGQRMTNGSVGTVAKAGSSLTMKVAYAGGTRTVTVTDKTPITVLTRLKPTALKPGENVLVGAVPGPTKGEKVASFVNVAPPAPAGK